MKAITTDEKLVSFCGLYCGACKAFLSEKCPGCSENKRASWCKVRSCCQEHNYGSCGDCKEFTDPADCKKFNNFISKIFSFIFSSDRHAGVMMIKDRGRAGFAAEMASLKRPSIKKQKL